MKDYKIYDGFFLVRNGKRYPDFAVGTYLRNESEILDLLNQYPYNKLMLDTAYRYGNERVVAQAIEKSHYPKENIIYIGKINTEQQESKKTIREEFFDTLSRLQIEKMDIYLIHSSRSYKIVETWKEMILLREEGFIDTIGVSNFDVEAINKLYFTSGVYPEVNQIVLPGHENKNNDFYGLLQFCMEKDILVQIASPFGGNINSETVSVEERKILLKTLRQKKLTCVFGTKNIVHLCQNVAWICLGR